MSELTNPAARMLIDGRLVDAAASFPVVNPATGAEIGRAPDAGPDPGTVCGPVISALQRDRILGYLELARQEGGTFATGGGVDDAKDGGFWIRPTVIAGLGNDDAVRIANDSEYGLSGSVDGSPERAHAVARRIRTGTVAVNGGIWYHADAPFGGYKQSGIGREMGVAGFEEYLQTKVVAEQVRKGAA